jgi:hypothetical protein
VTTARAPYAEIFLLSLGVILFEVSYTRVFSYKLVYYFTYVIIGLALLGLGTSAICATISPRLRRAAASRLLPVCCLAAAASVLGGYLVVAITPVNAMDLIAALSPLRPTTVVVEGAKLGLVCLVLFAPFFFAGLAIAAIFATHADRIARLYGADLVGAGLGCACAVPVLSLLTPPGGVLAAGFVFAVAGLRTMLASARWLVAPTLAVAIALVAGALAPDRLPDVVPDQVKTRATPLFSSWSPVFRIDVIPSPTRGDQSHLILHDGLLGSTLQRFDGNWNALERFQHDSRSVPFRLLASGPRVLVIGAAGGHEILASLYFGASHVTAVELNPATVSLLTTHFADYTGHLADDPRVTLVTGEGRSFLGRDSTRYDLVWFVAPDSYAAMNAATSGAFVLSESYLYTVEMIMESLRHLTPGGIVCAQFGEADFDRKPSRTARYLGTAREAFRRLGIEDFERHVLVSTTSELFFFSTILLGGAPFDDAHLARFREANAAIPRAVVRHAGETDSNEAIAKVVSLPPAELAEWYRDHPFDLRPVTDDAPFFWHFVRFRDAPGGLARYGKTFFEEGTGERLLLVLLVLVVVLGTVFLLAPMVALGGTWRAIPHKTRAGLYFAALGIGFMFLEVTLIQRLTLFLGYPTYSLTVTLFALLVSTGVGSLLADTAGSRRRALLRRVAVLVLLVPFYAFALPLLLAAAVGWPLAARIVTAALCLAPLGLCLGGFMPIGLAVVASLSASREEFVAWSWAVNGFSSVVSSVLATILAMELGFSAVMLLALGAYLVGAASLLGLADEPLRG